MEIKCAYDKIVNLSELVEHPLNDNKHTEEHARAYVMADGNKVLINNKRDSNG